MKPKPRIDIDFDEIIKQTGRGIKETVPVLDKNPRGAIFSLILLAMILATIVIQTNAMKTPSGEETPLPKGFEKMDEGFKVRS